MSDTHVTHRDCDICGFKASFTDKQGAPSGWKHTDYDLNGECFPPFHVCPECIKSPKRSDTARKIGEIIMQSIGGTQ